MCSVKVLAFVCMMIGSVGYSTGSKACAIHPQKLKLFRKARRMVSPEPIQILRETEGPLSCVLTCLNHLACHSVSYNHSNSVCELNDSVFNSLTSGYAIVEPVEGVWYTEMAAWPDRMAGPCARHNCLLDQVCSKKANTFNCENILYWNRKP